jgi:hypothetical protein
MSPAGCEDADLMFAIAEIEAEGEAVRGNGGSG